MSEIKMHPEFPAWYGQIDITESAERLSQRWAGVVNVVKSIDDALLTTILDICLGFDRIEPDVRFYEAFSSEDPYFGSKPNERERRLLAEIVLIVLADRRSGLSTTYGIGAVVRSEAAIGLHVNSHTFETDLPGAMQRARHSRANAIRDRAELPALKAIAGIDISKEIAETEFSDDEKVKTLFALLAKRTNAAITSTNTRMQAFGTAIETQTRKKDEELDLLWWLTVGQSVTTGVELSKIPPENRCLLIAIELSSLTRFRPGPASIDGLMTRAGVTNNSKKKLSARDVVNACDLDWLRTILIPEATHLTPINYAISKRIEAAGDDTWSEAWGSATRLDANETYTELQLTYQIYVERLALKQFGIAT